MKLSDYIKIHFNGVKRQFSQAFNIQTARTHEMLKSKREHLVLSYRDDDTGELVTSVFRESRELTRVK